MRRHDDRERGAALVEFALVASLLITLIFGITEFGLAFRDWLTVTGATRSGARVGSAAGQDPAADILILRAVESAMASSDLEDVQRVLIFRAKADGSPITTSSSGTTNVYVRSSGGCGWTPCPDPSSGLFSYGGGWVPADRNVAVGPGAELDLLGVRIVFVHEWLTSVISSGESTWTDDAVMRMEPQLFIP